MHPLATIIKRLKDNGIFDAVIACREIEQRRESGLALEEKFEWHAWDKDLKTLFDDRFSFRIKPQPREWWLRLCQHHGSSVDWVQPPRINNCCEIVHVIEDLKKL